MSLNQSLSISLDSMRNNQMALAVVSHNIANLNTEGYARERVNFTEDRASVNSNSVIAKIAAMRGADISSISSYVDNAAFKGLINSNSDASYYNGLKDALSDLENVADDLGDNGLNALLNDFFKASSNLEQFPTDLSIRQQYVMSLDSVCDKFNYITDRYDSIQDDKFNEVETSVFNINNLFSNLATANLAHIKNGQGASTQMEINSILSELSNYADVHYDQNDNGSYNLYVAGIAVVQGTEQVYELKTNYDSTQDEPLTISLQSLKDSSKIVNINDTITTGSLKSAVDFLNGTSSNVGFTTVKDMKNAIKSAETAFKDALNAIQTYSDPANNEYAAYITSSGGNLVLASDGNDPNMPLTPPDILVWDSNGKLAVNSQVMENPFYVAAARVDLDNYQAGEDWTQSIGNADNAGFITALQNEKICSFGGGTNNCTLSQFLINNAAKNGMDLASMENKAELYQGIADSSAQDYANMTGVNLDEELADMIRYQRAYEASAAIFSAVNNIMQTIIAMI
ncbi:MAG: flagellar hook-associated protein FlgK [Candidatus Gastranaerophilales bacterium]|nr:flagellar hook-associated protein FlgK [Candidatus Gastranaerophilales bacterium]